MKFSNSYHLSVFGFDAYSIIYLYWLPKSNVLEFQMKNCFSDNDKPWGKRGWIDKCDIQHTLNNP